MILGIVHSLVKEERAKKYKEREYNGKCKSAACIKKVIYYEFPSFGVDDLPLTLPGMRLVEIRVS